MRKLSLKEIKWFLPVIHNSRSSSWGKKWQPTPVVLSERVHGRGVRWATVHGVIKSQTRLRTAQPSTAGQLVPLARVSSSFRFVPWLPHSQWCTAAAAAKSLQSCPTLCDPRDGSPPGSPVPGILHARTLEWVAISFSNAWKWKVKVKSLQSCPTLHDPMDCSPPGSSIHGIFQARVLEWVPLPSPIFLLDIYKWLLLYQCTYYISALSKWYQSKLGYCLSPISAPVSSTTHVQIKIVTSSISFRVYFCVTVS